MAENVFAVVKQSVSTRDAAAMYGIEVRRNGMACCPFHDDKNPSMKVDHRFHCFGCGADGDVIDFAARLYNLSPKEAAQKLAQDFSLIYDSQAPPRRNYIRQKSEVQKFKEEWQHCFHVLSEYYHLLKKWEVDNVPKTPEEEPHPRFMEAVQKKAYIEYLLDFLLYDSEKEQKAWIAAHKLKVTQLERRLEKMAENKPTNRERLREITDGIEQGIKELFESEKYMRYLSVMSRFHRYSVNNTMLIYMQKPEATLVAGYNKWKNQFERHVKKGERGITIIAPTPYKKKIEEQKLDPDTNAPILDKDGKVITEEKEIEIPMFRPVKVFDVSQTDGKPLPELASALSGNVQNYEIFMEALRRAAPVPIAFEAMAADMDGYFSAAEQRIAIRQGMSEVQTVSATVHEIAHSKLHDHRKQEKEEVVETKNRRTEEVEAESISYAVCQYYGIQTGENSFGYIASWSQGKELKELRASLETINKTSCELISDIDRHYKEICKERGIDLTAKEEMEIQKESETFRYYITKAAVDKGVYPFQEGCQVQFSAELESYEDGKVQAFGYVEYPEKLSLDEVQEYALIPAGEDKGLPEQIHYYVAECMEFPNLGEYHDNLSLDEAIRFYQEIPADRMNGIKGIGFDLRDGSDYEGTFPILEGKTIDLDMIQTINYYRDSPLVQKAVRELIEAMPEMEVIEPNVQQKEALLVLDDAVYLHIQSCDSGWDYTLYDAKSLRELDGGQLDEPELSRFRAALQICENHDLGGESIKYAPLSMIETLQEAAYQQMQEQVSQQAEENAETHSQLPEYQEQTLDEYPKPDLALTQDDLEKCGYLDSDLLPLSKERAYELMERDLTVYMIQEGENPEMAFDSADLDAHDGIFAVDRGEWEQSEQFHEKIMERQEHQQEREQAFLAHKEDCFAIYQVSNDDPQNVRFMNLDWLRSKGISTDRSNYDLVYTAPLTSSEAVETQLEKLYAQFNMEKPVDFHYPSMSVSDIVAVKHNGVVSCHYCDSVGFVEIQGFLSDNPLKNAEMSMEDDYGMIDGIINNGPKEPTVAQLEQQANSGQPISLMDLAAATHREEQEKKKSIVDQLKNQPKPEHKKTAPKKSAEREI